MDTRAPSEKPPEPTRAGPAPAVVTAAGPGAVRVLALLLVGVALSVGLSVGTVYLLWMRDRPSLAANGAGARGDPAASGPRRSSSLGFLPARLSKYAGPGFRHSVETFNTNLPLILQKNTGVRVVVADFPDDKKTPWQAGRELGVGLVLVVRYTTHPNEREIEAVDANLLDVDSGLSVWTKVFVNTSEEQWQKVPKGILEGVKPHVKAATAEELKQAQVNKPVPDEKGAKELPPTLRAEIDKALEKHLFADLFTVIPGKGDYDKVNNRLVWLLEAKVDFRDYSDGKPARDKLKSRVGDGDPRINLRDADGVSVSAEYLYSLLTFEPSSDSLKKGNRTRCYLKLPADCSRVRSVVLELR